MTKRGAILLLILLLAFVSPATLRAQGEVTPGAFDKVDTQFAAVEAEVNRLQGPYLGLAGRYLQTLPSADTAPDKDSPQNYLSSPSDVGISLADLGAALPADLALSFEVSEYLGPQGPGYTVAATATVDGKICRRLSHHGPESWRDSNGWQCDELP